MSNVLVEFEELWAAFRAGSIRYSKELLNGSLNDQCFKIKSDKHRKAFARHLKGWFEDLSYWEKVQLVQCSIDHEILWANISPLLSGDLMNFRVLVS